MPIKANISARLTYKNGNSVTVYLSRSPMIGQQIKYNGTFFIVLSIAALEGGVDWLIHALEE